MSNTPTWGSVSDNNNPDSAATGLSHRNGSQEYSAMDTYLGKPESHEQIVLGFGGTNKKDTWKHKEKMNRHIQELESNLPK